MRTLLSLFLLSAFAISAFGNLTNLVREPFSGYGTNTSTATGAFNVVVGTLNRRAVGARLIADTSAASQGWSARVEALTGAGNYMQAFWNLTNSSWTAGQSNGVVSAWFRFAAPNAGTGKAQFLQIVNTVGNLVVTLEVQTNTVSCSGQLGGAADLASITYGRWYHFAIEWHKLNSGNNNHDARVYMMDLEAASPTLIKAWTNVSANGSIAQAGIIDVQNGGTTRYNGRISLPSLYQTANIGDGATYDADIIRPPTNNPTWYVDPATGNDTNSGVTPLEAWQTAGKINEEAATEGLLFATNYTLGPTLVLDTTGAALDSTHTNLTLATRGLNLKATNALYWTNKLDVTLTNSDFKAHSLPNVYHIATENNFGFGQSNIVIWEDPQTQISNDYGAVATNGVINLGYSNIVNLRATNTADSAPMTLGVDYTLDAGKGLLTTLTHAEGQDWIIIFNLAPTPGCWMYHPAGGTFASVSNYMVTNAGSFWTDGVTNFIHPFGNTDPRTDGKVYTRSVARDVTGFAFAINLNASDMNFRDCYAGKNSMILATDNANGLASYVLGSGGGFGGTSRVEHCYFFYTAKHAVGYVTDADNSDLTTQNVQAEQAYPTLSSSIFVSYMGGATKTNNTHRYLNCTNLHNIGAYGSTLGANDNQAVLYMHNNGSGVQFRDIILKDCFFSGKASIAITTNATITDSTLGAASLYAVNSNIVERVRFIGTGLDLSPSGSSNTVVRNCIAVHTNFYSAGQWNGWNLRGPNLLMENNTFDFSGISDDAPTAARGVLHLSLPMALTFRGNLVKMGQTANSVFDNFSTNSTFAGSNNIYQLGTSNFIAANYTNGAAATNRTLAQWQALGFDLNSIQVPDVRVDAQYRPLGDSRARDFGVSLGVASDFTGQTFPNRNDAGAVEYRRPRGFRGGR